MAKQSRIEVEPALHDICSAISTLLPGVCDGLPFDAFDAAGLGRARNRCLLALLARLERIATSDVIDEALAGRVSP